MLGDGGGGGFPVSQKAPGPIQPELHGDDEVGGQLHRPAHQELQRGRPPKIATWARVAMVCTVTAAGVPPPPASSLNPPPSPQSGGGGVCRVIGRDLFRNRSDHIGRYIVLWSNHPQPMCLPRPGFAREDKIEGWLKMSRGVSKASRNCGRAYLWVRRKARTWVRTTGRGTAPFVMTPGGELLQENG